MIHISSVCRMMTSINIHFIRNSSEVVDTLCCPTRFLGSVTIGELTQGQKNWFLKKNENYANCDTNLFELWQVWCQRLVWPLRFSKALHANSKKIVDRLGYTQWYHISFGNRISLDTPIELHKWSTQAGRLAVYCFHFLYHFHVRMHHFIGTLGEEAPLIWWFVRGGSFF